jgi:predicted membrane-bound spermidine synthase
VAGLAFFASGASALVYQVAWQRILALHTGVGIASIAVIVASFMAGIGLGSHLGGVLSTRLTPPRALRTFGLLEVGIAVFGLLSCGLYYDLLYRQGLELYSSPVLGGVLHFVGLLFPTLLMGMSLPFLVRALVHDVGRAGRTVGFLYGVNMLGASVGALLTPWVLLRFLGVRGAVGVAAAGNLLAATCVLLLLRAASAASAEGTGVEGEGRPVERRPFALWMTLYALSGFCALALEILWFRMVDVGAKGTAFTFGTVLAIYLLGSAIGALAGATWADRLKRPLLVFTTLQAALLVYAGLGALAIARLPVDTPLYEWLFGYWRAAQGFRLGTDRDLESLVRLYLVFPNLLYLVPTVLMGLSFPVLQRAVHDDPKTSGRKVGFLQAANIAGCTAGSLLVGLVLLEWLGTPGTLRVLVACGLLFVAVGWRHHGPRPALLGLGAVLAGLVVALPGSNSFWQRLHGLDGSPAFFDEDASSVAGVTPQGGRFWFVFVDGKSHSVLPYGDDEHTLLGAVPAVIHPAPVEAAIVGLGSGNTAWAAGCRPETERIRVFEIASPQVRLLHELDRRERFPRLRTFLKDPRVRVETADGRHALALDTSRYDLIEADALWPWSAYSGNLYSAEFFDLCARRLKPGGVVCTWAPTPRIAATFARVFPDAVDVGGILVGSLDPLPFDVGAWTERARSPEVQEYLGRRAARGLLRSLRGARRLVPDRDLSINRDLNPRDEFASP